MSRSASQFDHIVRKFGGKQKLKKALNMPHITTINYWEQNGFIHSKDFQRILIAGQDAGVDIGPCDFVAFLKGVKK